MSLAEFAQAISNDTGLPAADVLRIARSAPFRYKHYQIAKRNGGLRDIYHPSAELKTIQYWVISNIIEKYPIHSSVYSYRKGINIKMHALCHSKSRYFYKLDFEDFFPSIKFNDVKSFLSNVDEDQDLINFLCLTLCRAPKGKKINPADLALSIGAPSSPALSNRILYNLDQSICELCKSLDVIYTRYADDLYFSTSKPHTLEQATPRVRDLIKQHTHPNLSINEQKTSSVSFKHQVQITGLKITPRGDISLGRNRKRKISSMIHHFKNGTLDIGETSTLKGLLAFASDAEPDFIKRLTTKYSVETINMLLEQRDG